MDIRNILGKLDQLTEGTMAAAKKKDTGPKFTGKMKGTDPAPAAKDKYVGGESILRDLEAKLNEDPVKRDLSKEFKEFKEGATGAKPGWMLRQDPALAKKLKDQQARKKHVLGKPTPAQDKEQGVAEAAQGILHRVRYSYDDPSGNGTASGHITLHAPDKVSAARYATSDLTKRGKKNVRVHAVTPQKVAETALKGKEDLEAKHRALQDLEREPGYDKEAVRQRKLDLDKEAQDKGLTEFARDDFDDDRQPQFLPWEEFIGDLEAMLDEHFSVVQNRVKTTIKAKFVPHDPMEFGPTMLYSYYDVRAGRVGANSKRGAIQVGKFVDNPISGKNQFLSSFSILKGHPFQRHFDLTGENVQKIYDIIVGNTAGAYQMQPQQDVTETAPTQPGQPAAPAQPGKPTLGTDLSKPAGQEDAQAQQDQKAQQLAAQKEKQQQATLQKGVNDLKAAGAAVSNPAQVVSAFDKAEDNQGLTPGDKNSIASAGTVLAPIMANPSLQGKFKDLVTQASAAQKKEQQQQAQQPNAAGQVK